MKPGRLLQHRTAASAIPLYLRGDNSEPTAYIEVSVFSNENHIDYKTFTTDVTRIFNEILDIAPKRIYIRYSDITAWDIQSLYIEWDNELLLINSSQARLY